MNSIILGGRGRMKIIYFFDLEGVIGLYTLKDERNNLKLALQEINTVIKIIIKNPDAELTFCDCHNDGSMNTYLKEIYPDIHFLENIWKIHERNEYDFAIFTGFHAKEGAKGIFSHSFRSEFEWVKLGNKSVGELEIFINYLKAFKIKTVLVSGDAAAIEEISHMDCVKNVSKDKLFLKTFEKKYQELENRVGEAIDNWEHYTNDEYDLSEVRIKFRESVTIFQSKDMTGADNILTFRDTLQFVYAIDEICTLLNRDIYIQRIVSMMRHNRKLYLRAHKEPQMNILFSKDTRLLTDVELKSIYDTVVRLKRSFSE